MTDTIPEPCRLPERNEISYEEALRWFTFEHQRAIDRRVLGGADLETYISLEEPFWHRKIREGTYRRAYTQGYLDAIHDVQKLYCKLGCSRPKEIVAIMERHFDEALMAWRHDFYQDLLTKLKRPPPKLEQEEWPAIRERIKDRDGFACVVCGETRGLSVDHIVPVKRYGLPSDDNLQTLCRKHALEKLENQD